MMDETINKLSNCKRIAILRIYDFELNLSDLLVFAGADLINEVSDYIYERDKERDNLVIPIMEYIVDQANKGVDEDEAIMELTNTIKGTTNSTLYD
ncbi:hypothetical protein MASR1M45_06010 [Candidatus Kapaibacterium sp.]